jgi:hypothetical protein
MNATSIPRSCRAGGAARRAASITEPLPSNDGLAGDLAARDRTGAAGRRARDRTRRSRPCEPRLPSVRASPPWSIGLPRKGGTHLGGRVRIRAVRFGLSNRGGARGAPSVAADFEMDASAVSHRPPRARAPASSRPARGPLASWSRVRSRTRTRACPGARSAPARTPRVEAPPRGRGPRSPGAPLDGAKVDKHTPGRFLRGTLKHLGLAREGLSWYEATRHTFASQWSSRAARSRS